MRLMWMIIRMFSNHSFLDNIVKQFFPAKIDNRKVLLQIEMNCLIWGFKIILKKKLNGLKMLKALDEFRQTYTDVRHLQSGTREYRVTLHYSLWWYILILFCLISLILDAFGNVDFIGVLS